jgi:hypothetical protein
MRNRVPLFDLKRQQMLCHATRGAQQRSARRSAPHEAEREGDCDQRLRSEDSGGILPRDANRFVPSQAILYHGPIRSDELAVPKGR